MFAEQRVTRSRETSDVGHLAAGDQGKTGVLWQAEDVLQPGADCFFHYRGGRRAGVKRGILLPGRCEPIGRDRGG